MNQPKEYCIWVDVIKCYRRFEDDWRFGKSQVRWRCYQSRVAPGALPWQSSGYDSVFLPPRARFWSLVQKLRSNKPSEVAQSCPTLFGHMDYVLLGSSIHGIFQARVLEWVAISLSRGSSQPRDWIRISRIVGRCFTEPPGKPQWCGKKKKKCPQMEVKWKSLSCIRLFVTPWIMHGILWAKILEWVAFPFSRGSFQSRVQTQVSCIAGGFFTSWATQETLRCK